MSFKSSFGDILINIPPMVYVGVLLTVFVLTCQNVRNGKIDKLFYETEFKTKVNLESDWPKRSIYYYLDNGFALNFPNDDVKYLEIGDSLFKEKGTYVYNVYRKVNSQEYVFICMYNYKKNWYE
jgi:hypothetical protein